MKRAQTALSLLGLGIAVVLPLSGARADFPGTHPAFVHALADLRKVYSLVDHKKGDAAVNGHDDEALREIAEAIGDIKKAGVDDGKNIDAHVGVENISDKVGRLHKALEYLDKAHGDVITREDDPAAKSLQKSSIYHIDKAHHDIEQAIFDVQHHK